MAQKSFKTIVGRNVNFWFLLFRPVLFVLVGLFLLNLPIATVLLIAPIITWAEILLKSCFDYMTRKNIPEQQLKQTDAQIENYTNLAEWQLKMAVIAEYKPQSKSSSKLVKELKSSQYSHVNPAEQMKQQKKALRTYLEASHNAGKGLLWCIKDNFKAEQKAQEVTSPALQRG